MTGITIYSTTVCPWCVKLKGYLKEKGVSYKEIDVSKDREAARKMVEQSGHMGVPQMEINGKIIVGFDKAAIDKELAAAK